jgi:Fic family protein
MIREGRPPRDRSERMILNNYMTMRQIGAMQKEPLSKDMIFELHRRVTDGTLDDPGGAGRLRRDNEYRVVGDEFGEIFHRPPPAEQLEARMSAMCDFANQTDSQGFIHPVIRSIILHFWLAYDHPFVDGNGRTARALFYWSVLHHGYWLFEYVSISQMILRSPVRYGEAFLHTETDENDLTYFIIYHLAVVNRAVDELHRYIESRGRELRALDLRLRGTAELNHRQRDLIRHALRHPGFSYTIESHKNSHGIVYETARTDLADLETRGLLIKRKVGHAWVFTPVENLEASLQKGR